MKFLTISTLTLLVAASTALLAETNDNGSALLPRSPHPAGALVKRVHGDLHVEFGGNRKHVGMHVGQKLYGEVSKALQTICPEDMVSNPEKRCKGESIRLDGIEYNSNHKLAKDSYLELIPWFADFGGNNALREALIDVAAGSLMAQSNNPANCYTVDTLGFGAGKHEMCNVGSILLAHVSGGSGVRGKLNLYINWSGKTTEGGFNCGKSRQGVLDYLSSTSAPRVSKAVEYPFFDSFVTCRGGEDVGPQN